MIVTNEEQFAVAIERLRGTSPLALDLETSGLHMFARENPARLVGVAVGLLGYPETDCYISFRHGDGPNVPIERLAELRLLVEGRELVNHNLAFDMRMLHCDGFALPPKIRDTIIYAHMANENEESLALKKLGVKYLGESSDEQQRELFEDLKKMGYRSKDDAMGNMWRLPAEKVGPYAIQDIRLARRLLAFYTPIIEKWRLTSLCAERHEYQLALTRMELRGLRLDTDEVARQRTAIGPRLEAIRARLVELGAGEVNLNSPAQLCKWLGLTTSKKEVLEAIVEREQREDIRLLLEYRQLMKADTAFFLPLLEKASAANKVHTSFKVYGTRTGRLSSVDPNLQQQSRNQSGRKYSVRNCFVPDEGYFFVEADFSSVEPRTATHYSGDPEMLAAFRANLDFHSKIARTMFRREDISKEQRTDAKSLGLGVLYGMGSIKAAIKLGLRHDKDDNGEYEFHHALAWTVDDAEQLVQVPCSAINKEYCACAGKEYVNKYYAAWPALKPCITAVTKQAESFGYIRIPLTSHVCRLADKRKAYATFNKLVQGTAGEIMRRALMAVCREFNKPGDPEPLLVVHDSLLMQVPFGPNALSQIKRMKELMETTTEISVPLPVDVKVGLSMGNLGEIQL